MNEFVASNGVIIREHPGAIGVRRSAEDPNPVPVPNFNRPERVQTYLDPRQWDAIAEAVQAEADARLGRWRSTVDPAWTAVVDTASSLVYFRHDDGLHEFNVYLSGSGINRWTQELQAVAREYFDAHPEPKPWHDASIGDVWIMEPLEVAYTVVGGNEKWFTRGDVYGKVERRELDDSGFTSGRRIWPEVS